MSERQNLKLLLGVVGAAALAGYAIYKSESSWREAKDAEDEMRRKRMAANGGRREVASSSSSSSGGGAKLSASDARRMLDILTRAEPTLVLPRDPVSPFPRFKADLLGLRLKPNLAYACLSHLPMHELIRLSSVCRQWRAFVQLMLNHRDYIYGCARAGFPDGPAGRLRGHCWKLVCGSKEIMDKVTAASSEPGGSAAGRGSFYQRLVDRKTDDEDTVLKDVHRTLIHYKSFESPMAAQAALCNLLLAYAVHDPQVGYCQGMNFVAAFLLTKLDEEDAYWTLYTIMSSPKYRLRHFYLPDLSGLLVAKDQFQSLFESLLPQLHSHFIKNDVYSDMHTEWFMTLFTATNIPRETAARIWDLFLVEGYCIIHRVALAIIHLEKDALLLMDFEGIIHHLKAVDRHRALLNPDELMAAADYFSCVTPSMLARIERQFIRQKMEEQGIAI